MPDPKPLLLAVTALVAACNASPGPNTGVCGTPAPSEAQARLVRDETLKTPALKLKAETAYSEACVRRWAYRLAKSDESIVDIGAATLFRCQGALDRQISAAGGTAEARVELLEKASGQMRFYVIQARAGRCEVAGDE